MLRSIKEIFGYRLDARDGDIGSCKDFLFDDRSWTVRYMVADTVRWLPGRKVLLAPNALDEPDWPSKTIPVNLTKEQIENAPELDEHAPVSRQYEMQYHIYYGWPQYWTGMSVTNPGESPAPLYEEAAKGKGLSEEELDDPNLRSAKKVMGYDIEATDGGIGHVEDFIMEDETWIIRYMVIDTKNWLPGRKVLVPPEWTARVDWSENRVYVDLTREEVKGSPEFDPLEPVNREYEERLYNYYGQPVYW